jgi:hypothetical protein
MKRILVISAILAAMLLTGCGAPAATPGPTPTPKVDASPEMQEKRLALIEDCISKGIFYKVEKPATYPHVWVTPLFHSLNFDDKQAFISVVFAYYISKDPACDMVVLYDSKTGKEVGVFAEVYGGLKLE